MSETGGNVTADGKPGVARGRLRAVAWAGLGLLGGFFAGGATAAASGGYRMLRFAHGGWGHYGGASSFGERREHVDAVLRWALRGVDATEDQQQRVSTIATGCMDDLRPLHDRHRQNAEAIHALLVKPIIDRQALEELRKAEVQLADEAAGRVVRALADAAEVLTPEQRGQLVAFAERMHRH